MTGIQKEIQLKLQIERHILSSQWRVGYDISGPASGIKDQLYSKLQIKLSGIERALQHKGVDDVHPVH